MPPRRITDKLDTEHGIGRHLRALVKLDERLGPVLQRASPVVPRTTEPGFSGLAKVICGQQLSVASASAIWARFSALPGALDPAGYLRLAEADVRASGFSDGKFRTLRVVAEAIVAGTLDLDSVGALPAEQAVETLTRLKGIGPWTAEIYLLFCAGHPDVFPAGDLALQKAVAHALGLGERLGVRDLIGVAEAWSPHRGAAALLFWRYYAVMRSKEGILV